MAEAPQLNLKKPPGYIDPKATPSKPPRPRPGPGKLPVRLSFQPEKKRKKFLRICCCCVFIFLIVLILLFLIVCGLFILWFDPKLPAFHLQSFKFSSFNVTPKSDGTYLNAAAVGRVEVRNPNAMLAYRYGKSEVRVSVGEGAGLTELGSATLAGFAQAAKSTTSLKIETKVKDGVVQDGEGPLLLRRYKSKTLKVNVGVKSSVGLQWKGLEMGMLGVQVLCGDVTLRQLGAGDMPKCVINTLKWINIH
ncbi:hypothetical protein Tsubulata_040533 [Turnera subulata]|uniref:Late embryogenesis abundant protein LEA-2 subgroup domain-containing protein n=1 Tax=Turnera subulata TaxID=218843 RepID=A0A9Q0JD60_9ROSI|nr:hypothetical protein Tsubulata_040533 [Turnera subulata]